MNKNNLAGIFILSLLITYTPNLLAQCPTGDVILANQAEVNTFVANYGNCTSLPGSLTIGDDSEPIVSSDIFNISGLSSLTNVSGDLVISANPLLESLAGLDNLVSVNQSLKILDNDNLSVLGALNSVTSVGLFLDIIGNDALTILSGLNNIDVGLSTSIINNDNLNSITGLNNLDNGRALIIGENDNLLSISGLNNHSPGLATAFLNNVNLVDVSGFSVISNNSMLIIRGNTSLDICSADGICSLISAPLAHEIENNGSNCSTEFDIDVQCLNAHPVTLLLSLIHI